MFGVLDFYLFTSSVLLLLLYDDCFLVICANVVLHVTRSPVGSIRNLSIPAQKLVEMLAANRESLEMLHGDYQER